MTAIFSTFPMRHMKIFSKHEIMVRHRVQNLISVNKVRFLLGVVINGLTLTVQIQLTFHPCNPVLINNRNMTDNSV